MELSINEFYMVRNSNDTEIKEMHKSMTALGLSTHSMIKIVLGTPSDSSQYKVKIYEAKLTDEATDKGNQIYTTSQVGTLQVKPEDTGFVLKQKALELYNEITSDQKNKITDVSDFKLRNP